MSIELQRHHCARIKKNRSHYWGREGGLDPRQLGIASKTPKPCSCIMCRNPRKLNNELTMQEKKINQEPTEY